MSAFQVISPSNESIVYPYDSILPKRIMNPLIDFNQSSNNIQVCNANYISSEMTNNDILSKIPISLIKALFPTQKKQTFNSQKICVTAVKNQIEDTNEFKEAVEKYKLIENTKVICAKCQNSVNIVSCFNFNNSGYICLSCSLNHYNSIVELVDWEHCEKDSKDKQCYRCDRLKHAKELYSFIRFSNKRSRYEVGNLCIYCRNVKKFEYLMKQKNKRMQNHKKTFISQDQIKLLASLQMV